MAAWQSSCGMIGTSTSLRMFWYFPCSQLSLPQPVVQQRAPAEKIVFIFLWNMEAFIICFVKYILVEKRIDHEQRKSEKNNVKFLTTVETSMFYNRQKIIT